MIRELTIQQNLLEDDKVSTITVTITVVVDAGWSKMVNC